MNYNEDELIRRLQYYYDRSIAVMKDFGGPSVYFHIQAIKEQSTNFLSDRHIEMIYAMIKMDALMMFVLEMEGIIA